MTGYPKHIGPYQITGKLGEGGMGVVWSANDTRLNRSVALKMIRDSGDDEQGRTRFLREAQAGARVNHPNICRLYDIGEEGGRPFLVMELLEGESLATRLARGPMLLPEGVQTQEVDKAAALNPGAVFRVDSADVGVQIARATVLYLAGQIEMIWGKSQTATNLFSQSLEIAELPDAHYMLGLVYESEYNPAEALKHFERCLEQDPDGELSVPALREANAMRNYKKKFRGSWGLFFLMLLFFFPAAIVYFVVKYK